MKKRERKAKQKELFLCEVLKRAGFDLAYESFHLRGDFSFVFRPKTIRAEIRTNSATKREEVHYSIFMESYEPKKRGQYVGGVFVPDLFRLRNGF